MRKHLTLFFYLILFSLATVAQPTLERSVVSNAGGSWYDGSSFQLDYTLGEVAVLTSNNATNFLTQGFQQPFSTMVVNVGEASAQNLNVYIYPNPANDHFNVRIENATGMQIKCQILDMPGKLILQKDAISGTDESMLINFDISTLAAGNYFVSVCSGSRILKTARLIKINQ